eukprot:5564650-Amphidinium_carterae.2
MGRAGLQHSPLAAEYLIRDGQTPVCFPPRNREDAFPSVPDHTRGFPRARSTGLSSNSKFQSLPTTQSFHLFRLGKELFKIGACGE